MSFIKTTGYMFQHSLCDPGLVTEHLCTSVSFLMKWGHGITIGKKEGNSRTFAAYEDSGGETEKLSARHSNPKSMAISLQLHKFPYNVAFYTAISL